MVLIFSWYAIFTNTSFEKYLNGHCKWNPCNNVFLKNRPSFKLLLEEEHEEEHGIQITAWGGVWYLVRPDNIIHTMIYHINTEYWAKVHFPFNYPHTLFCYKSGYTFYMTRLVWCYSVSIPKRYCCLRCVTIDWLSIGDFTSFWGLRPCPFSINLLCKNAWIMLMRWYRGNPLTLDFDLIYFT